MTGRFKAQSLTKSGKIKFSQSGPTHIKIIYTPFDSSKVEELAYFIETDSKLTEIEFVLDNQGDHPLDRLSSENVKILIEAVKKNTTLLRFNFPCRRDQTQSVIYAYLLRNQFISNQARNEFNLEFFKNDHVSFTNESLLILKEALSTASNLHTLDLSSCNNMDSKILLCVEEILLENSSIRILKLQEKLLPEAIPPNNSLVKSNLNKIENTVKAWEDFLDDIREFQCLVDIQFYSDNGELITNDDYAKKCYQLYLFRDLEIIETNAGITIDLRRLNIDAITQLISVIKDRTDLSIELTDDSQSNSIPIDPRIGLLKIYAERNKLVRDDNNLITLDLSKSAIDDEGLNILINEVLIHLPNRLYHLNLANNQITYKGILILADWLKQAGKQFSILEICNNSIGDNGFEAISEALLSTNVQHIWIQNIQMTEKSIPSLVLLLNKKPIVRLNISYNNIGNAGLEILINNIKNNTCLTNLYIYHCGGSLEKVSSILTSLNANKAIIDLGLSIGEEPKKSEYLPPDRFKEWKKSYDAWEARSKRLANLINCNREQGQSLCEVIKTGDIKSIRKILNDGISLYTISNDKGQQSLIELAFEYQRYHVVEFLVQQGFNLFFPGNGKIPALFLKEKTETASLIAANSSKRKDLSETEEIVHVKKKKAIETRELFNAIRNNNYKELKKLIALDPSCVLSQDEPTHDTPLHAAIKVANIDIVSYLLIGPKAKVLVSMKNANEETADNLANKLRTEAEETLDEQHAQVYQQIINLLDNFKNKKVIEQTNMVHWLKHFSFIYGSRYSKPQKTCMLDLDELHAMLKLHNPPTEEGNTVTAALTFIVSSSNHSSGGQHSRRAISIKLLGKQGGYYHITHFKSRTELKQRLSRRIEQLTDYPTSNYTDDPSDQNKALSKEAIEFIFNQNPSNNSAASFEEFFHHSEQALLEFLDREDATKLILQHLARDPYLTHDCKIYPIIVLSIYSPLAVCPNCEVGILAEQDSAHSDFLKKLEVKLRDQYKLSASNPLRMVTCVSSSLPGKRRGISIDEDGKAVLIDLRSNHFNSIIFQKDDSEEKSKALIFGSRQN